MSDGADASSLSGAALPAGAAHSLLQVWLSPSFPVGAFAYSHGLEKAAELGWVRDGATLPRWLTDLIEHGSLRNDLILLASAWHAARQAMANSNSTPSRAGHQTLGSDTPPTGLTRVAPAAASLATVNELALALQPSAERYLESSQQGASFRRTMGAAWSCPAWEAADAALGPGEAAYCVAVGAAAAAHGVPLALVLRGYAIAFIGNLVSAAIRLSIVGQTDGQRVIAGLMPVIDGAAAQAAVATLEDLGGAAFRSDIASLSHETQYTRLFRS